MDEHEGNRPARAVPAGSDLSPSHGAHMRREAWRSGEELLFDSASRMLPPHYKTNDDVLRPAATGFARRRGVTTHPSVCHSKSTRAPSRMPRVVITMLSAS